LDLLDPWDNFQFELEDVIDAGDRTLVAVHIFGRGKTSGFEMDARFYSVLTWRSGRAIRVENIFDRAQALQAAEVVFYQNADFPDSPPLRGREGLLEWVEDVNEVWEGAHFEPHTFRASGDFVVVSGRGTGRARGSGIPMDLPAHQVFRLRNGRVSEMWGYSDEAQALEVAGLRE
jgi:ketosteroid isomerase-like protein